MPLTVVFRPPAEVATTNDIVEDKADDCPGNVVDCTRRRDGTRSCEDHGEVDEFQEPVLPP